MEIRDLKISTMKALIHVMKRKGVATDEVVCVLEHNFQSLPLEFIKNQFKNSRVAGCHKRYTEEMKTFSLTLYFYSPKAYRFLREKFHLPNDRTIRQWMSSFHCNVGFLEEVFEFLKQEVTEKDYLKNCALIMDAMSIRKQILWDKKMIVMLVM